MSEVESLFDLVRLAIGGLIVILGVLILLGGVLGLLRFPDFYTRLHAARVGDTVGGVVLVIGLAVAAPNGDVALRLLLLAVLLAALGPTLSHLMAGATHAAGLAPIAGRYTAPRPGAKRGETS